MRNPIYAICEQQRRRPACASAQSDQRHYCSLPRWYNISSFYIRNFKPLAGFCGCAGRFVSYLVGNPEDRFSRDVAQIEVAILMGMIVGIVYSYEPPHDKTNKVACAPSEYSDQPGHPPSLISVFAVRMKKAWVLSYPLSAQRRL